MWVVHLGLYYIWLGLTLKWPRTTRFWAYDDLRWPPHDAVADRTSCSVRPSAILSAAILTIGGYRRSSQRFEHVQNIWDIAVYCEIIRKRGKSAVWCEMVHRKGADVSHLLRLPAMTRRDISHPIWSVVRRKSCSVRPILHFYDFSLRLHSRRRRHSDIVWDHLRFCRSVF